MPPKPGNSAGSKRANQRTSPSLAIARRGPPKPAMAAAAAAKSAPANSSKSSSEKRDAKALGAASARQPARGNSAAKAPRAGSSASTVMMLVFAALVVSLVAALPTVPIVLLGMIPTAVAFFVDRNPHKTAAIGVAGLNFAGVAPFVAVLWHQQNTLYHSIAILSDVYSWLAMYGAAALGWLLYLALPPIATTILSIFSAQRIASLEAQQAKLRDEWGIKPARKEP